MKTKDVVSEGIEKHVLDLLVCEKGLDLGGFAAQNLRVSVMKGLYDNEILDALHTLIPAENMKEETHTVSAKYPSDWKEAFKEQHFPIWLKTRYPVKYKTVTETVKFTAYKMFPHFPRIDQKYSGESVRQIIKTVI